MKRFVSLALLCLFLVPVLVWAQSDRGSIVGTVTDASGAVVPGARVTATHVNTKVQTTTTTNEVGLYSILNLPIGNYTVSFIKQGFKTLDRDGITVAVAQVVKLDATMEVGAVAETITVTEAAPLLESQSVQVGAGMNASVVTDLPLNIAGGRAIENFAYATVPGVEGNNWTSYIAGSMAFSKEVLIDGTSAVAQIGGHIGESSPTMEAIQEFKIETSGVRAEDGRTGGGVYKFTIKSGTNELHGSAFLMLHNEVLNANTWQNTFRAQPRSTDRQRTYGFSGGGPIRKNKTFVFGAFEKYTQERMVLGAFNKTVPISAFLDGNFSALLNTSNVLGTDALGRSIYSGMIFDPATQRTVKAGEIDPTTGLTALKSGTVKEGFGFDKATMAPLPGLANIIPAGRVSAISKRITDIYRSSYRPMRDGLTNNAAITRQNDPWFHQTQLTFKGDHNFSEKNRLSGHMIWTERPRILVDQGGIWDPNDPLGVGGPFANSRKQEVTSRRFAANHSYTISPTLLNTFSFTYNRYRNPSIQVVDKDWSKDLGLAGAEAPNFPVITFGNAVNGIWTERIGAQWQGFYVGNTFIWNNTTRWVKGRHTLSFGADIRAMQISSHSGESTYNFSFGPEQTGLFQEKFGNNTTGFGFASFLLGGAASASLSTPFDLYGRRKAMSLFIQDDFKVMPKLTLALDLRWDHTFPFKEKYGHWANFDKTAINKTYGIPGALVFLKDSDGTFETKNDWKAFGPHIGAAYQLTSKVVLRGAYGIFFSPIGINYWFGVPYGFAPGFRGDNRVTSKSDRSPAFYWDSGYPGKFVPGTLNPDLLTWGYVSVDPKSTFAGYTHEFTSGVQFELFKDTRVDVQYMGTLGRRLQAGELARNQPTGAALTTYLNMLKGYKEWNNVWDAATAASAGVPYPYSGFGSYAFAAVLPYPQLWQNWNWAGPLFHVGTPIGLSDYNALQIAVTKRGAHGLSFNGGYTLSAAHSNVQSASGFQETWIQTGPVQDISKAKEEAAAPISYDQRHVFKGIVMWEMPFGKGRRLLSNLGRVGNAVVGGWTLSGSFRYNTGSPLGVNSSRYYAGWDGAIYANQKAGGDFSRKFNGGSFDFANPKNASNLFFDTGNFSNPPYGELGNGLRYRSDFRGFGWSEEQLGLMKNFHVGERFRLQFRAEFYNIFNRHHFSNPDTNIQSATFGKVINLTGTPREGQIGLRFEW